MKTVMLLVMLMLFSSLVHADDVYIDMQKIRMIESSGNPRAYNASSHARGLYQITPIVLREWNNYHPREQYTLDQLFSSTINSNIAHWYMNYRIPQMLKHYRCKDTVENRLICYNAGISYVVLGKALPAETVQYIDKYNK